MIWLSVSLFCCKNNWNKLFGNGIIPFVNNSTALKAYTTEINYLSGENIRLFVLVDEKDAAAFAKKTDGYFKAFFLASGFRAPQIKLPVDGMFMPFPANTVQFGLYPSKKITASQLVEHTPAIHLSQIIVQTLKNEVIDDEVTLTFAFYLKMGLLKMVNLAYPHFISCLKSRGIPVRDDKDAVLKFNNVKETLIEITADIFQAAEATDLPNWFNQWEAICRQNINTCRDELAAQTFYNKMSTHIFTQLGLSGKMNTMLNYFIHGVPLYEEL